MPRVCAIVHLGTSSQETKMSMFKCSLTGPRGLSSYSHNQFTQPEIKGFFSFTPRGVIYWVNQLGQYSMLVYLGLQLTYAFAIVMKLAVTQTKAPNACTLLALAAIVHLV